MSNRKIHIGQRNASSSRKLNSGSEFYNEYGDLKEGYSYQGGNGTVAVGMGRVGGTRGAGKDGMQAYSEDRTIFGVPPSSTKEPERKAQPAPTPPPQPEPKKDLVIQPTRPDETRGRGQERKNPHVPRNPDLSKYPAPENKGPMDIFLDPVDPNRDYGDPFSPGGQKGPDKDFIPTPKNQNGSRKKGPGYVDHMPVDPNRDYGESPFSKHTSSNDYTFTPQAQEAKERALNFKYNFDRS